MAKDLILVGGGGHCLSAIDVIESQGAWSVRGILDRPSKRGESVLGYEVIGTDDDIARWKDAGAAFLVTIGFIKDPAPRVAAYERLAREGAVIPVVVSPRATVARTAVIGIGTAVFHHAVVNAGATVGENVIVNTAAVVEHGAVVGDHSHVSTGAFVNGDCVVGRRVFIGSHAVLAHGVTVGDDIIIGAGAVVVRSIDAPGVYIGNPARRSS